MECVVDSSTLRRRASEYVGRASAGETILVTRRGRPMAFLRPPVPGERLTRISVTTFRRTLRSALRTARSRPVLLTWHGGEAAVVAPVPKGFRLGAEE
ncbi:MAG: type II toxin-antitoxin system prevent-host-death family antitoxin [Chloroflexi bacterium]|nr:type II toxin-antitoxin system prevent-host-death family antitoxin [Chloroflexota bacterium]